MPLCVYWGSIFGEPKVVVKDENYRTTQIYPSLFLRHHEGVEELYVTLPGDGVKNKALLLLPLPLEELSVSQEEGNLFHLFSSFTLPYKRHWHPDPTLLFFFVVGGFFWSYFVGALRLNRFSAVVMVLVLFFFLFGFPLRFVFGAGTEDPVVGARVSGSVPERADFSSSTFEFTSLEEFLFAARGLGVRTISGKEERRIRRLFEENASITGIYVGGQSSANSSLCIKFASEIPIFPIIVSEEPDISLDVFSITESPVRLGDAMVLYAQRFEVFEWPEGSSSLVDVFPPPTVYKSEERDLIGFPALSDLLWDGCVISRFRADFGKSILNSMQRQEELPRYIRPLA